MSNNFPLARKYLLLFIVCNLLLTTGNFSQSVTGSVTNIFANRGTGVIVDDALTIIYGENIIDASVFITTNFQSGDMLSINEGMIPGGGYSTFDAGTGGLKITGIGTAAQWQAVLRTVQFTGYPFAGGTKTISFNLGSAAFNPANGHYYQMVNPGMTWTNGKASAESSTLFGLAGYLATITSYSENVFISSRLKTDGWMGCSDDYLQINAATGTNTYTTQADAEGNWYWVCGPEKGTLFSRGNLNPATVTFASWNYREPNNSGGEHYGQFYANRNAWNDLPNSPLLPLIVEYGGTTADPLVDISHSRNVSILVPTLTGNDLTKAYYTNDNQAFIVDPTVHFINTGVITDVTVNISGAFTAEDFLDINELLVPAGVTSSYDQASGTWYFQGMATPEQWRPLMASITFRTTSADLSDRTVTFSMGSKPATAEGHFYALSAFPEQFDYNNMSNYMYYHPELATYSGMSGYHVNIQSAAENEFLKKFRTDFWLPLTDDYNILGQTTGQYYMEQSESESKFYWFLGIATGTLVSTGNTGSMVAEGNQYNNWDVSEPGNIGDPENGNSSYFNSIDGKWYNDLLYGPANRSFVLEYGGSPDDPAPTTIFTKTMSVLGVLPVTLTKFTAKVAGKTVIAEWETSAEKNNSYFNLERSANNNNFIIIGKVEGGGTATSPRTYYYTDMQPLTGLNYYRLKQVDIDNHFAYSPIRKVDFSLKNKTSLVYPTLVTSKITVQMLDPGFGQCYIINAAGTVVKRIIPTGPLFTTDVNTLPKGVYIFRIISTKNGGTEENFRFVKQ